MKKNIAIFVSGNGTNFEKIVDYLDLIGSRKTIGRIVATI